MCVEHVQVWVIQSKSDGLFLTEELRFSRSFKEAGRCYSFDEARDTASCNLDGDYEIHSFYERDYMSGMRI